MLSCILVHVNKPQGKYKVKLNERLHFQNFLPCRSHEFKGILKFFLKSKNNSIRLKAQQYLANKHSSWLGLKISNF